MDEQLGVICADINIEFMPGFGPEDFMYVPGGLIPVVVRYGMGIPDVILEGYGQVIGMFDGGTCAWD